MTTIELKKYINENDKVPFILEKCGCHHIKDHGEYVSAANPDGDNPGAINIYKNDYLNYVNYTRGVSADMKQDIINLVQSTKGMNFIDAFKWLHEANEISFSSGKSPSKKPINTGKMIVDIFKKYRTGTRTCDVRDIKFIDPKELNDFEPKLFIDWFREGVMPWTAKKFGLMYSYRNHRIIIPIYFWADGRIIGCNARTTIKDYNLLGISKFYITKNLRKDINIYGLWQNREAIEKAKIVFICESEKGVLKMDSRGDARWVALQGKIISAEQKRILLGLNINEIVISLDNDVPEEYIWGLAEKFYGLRKITYTLDKWNILGEKDSVTDMETKKIKYLLEHRKEYTKVEHDKYIKYQINKGKTYANYD